MSFMVLQFKKNKLADTYRQLFSIKIF